MSENMSVAKPFRKLIKCVILDLDGTLINTDGIVGNVLKVVLGKYGKEWDGREAHKILGKTPFEAASAVVEDYGLPCSTIEFISEILPLFSEQQWMRIQRGKFSHFKDKYILEYNFKQLFLLCFQDVPTIWHIPLLLRAPILANCLLLNQKAHEAKFEVLNLEGLDLRYSYPSPVPMHTKNLAVLKRQLIRKKMVKSAKECMKQQGSNSELYGKVQAMFIEWTPHLLYNCKLWSRCLDSCCFNMIAFLSIFSELCNRECYKFPFLELECPILVNHNSVSAHI